MNPETQRKADLLHARTQEYQTVVASAKQTIYHALQHMKNPYVSFSGGKDSLVMLHLVLEQKRVPVVYWDADASNPDTENFLELIVDKWDLDMIRFKTESMMSVFRKYGINHPKIEEKTMLATVYRPIKKLMRDYDFDGVFVGLREEESFGRRQLIRHKGSVFWNKSQGILECLPVAYFSVQDIWAYITSHDLPYNAVYDRQSLPRNEIRVSYWCGESAREFGRFVWLKKEYPDLYNKFAAEFPEVREWC